MQTALSLKEQTGGGGGDTRVPSTGADSPGERHAQAWLNARLERARREGVFAEVVIMTAEKASLLLKNNPDNRNKSPTGLARLKADFLSGEIDLTGDTIKVAMTGELNDGQHRLYVCEQTGIPFETVIVFGLERASRTKVDQGIKRTIGSILSMKGLQSSNHLAHAALLVFLYENHCDFPNSSAMRPTISQVESLIEQNPTLPEFLAKGRRFADKFRISRGLAGALYFLLSRQHLGDAEVFFSSIQDNFGFSGKKDPRNRLVDALTKNAGAKAKLPPREIAALIIKAWNLWREGKPSGGLAWRSRGIGAEAFPIIR